MKESVKHSNLSKKEQRILNKMLQTRMNCRWYVSQGRRGEFCTHPNHTRHMSNYAVWGLCNGVCGDFEAKGEGSSV